MKKYIFSMMAIAALLCGCGKDDADNGGGVEDGNYISFGLAEETRAEYSDSDAWQVVWEENDPIRIYSAEARSVSQSNNADAPYTVTGVSANKGSITKVNANALQWGDAETYDFYAFYPDATARLKGYDHKEKRVTIDFNSNQVCKLGALEGTNYPTSIEEDAIVMVASATGVAKNTDVKLKFKPIMTTLEIKVKGQANTSTIITGVSIITQFTGVDYLNSDGTFVYDIDEGKIVPVGKSDNTHTLFLALDKEVTISGNQTVTLTALVPPVDLTAENTTIQVHSTSTTVTGVAGVSSLRLPVTIPAGHKKILNLPNLPSPVTNKWITPLDDNIYVSQLSIPGTHDAATSSLEASLTNAGATQTKTLEEQLEMGIRAFDIRVSLKTSWGSWTTDLENIHHATLDTEVSLDEAFATFGKFLTDNPKEFVIIIMRNESGDTHPLSYVTDNQKAQCAEKYREAMTTYLSNSTIYQNRKVDFTPDLTIGDMRGRILILARDQFGTDTSRGTAVSGGAAIGWNHSWNGALATGRELQNRMTGANTNGDKYILAVQDMFKNDENKSDLDWEVAKPLSVMQLMDYSAVFNTDASKYNYWAINHTSGYTGVNNYPNNASITNPIIYEYLIGNEVTLNNVSYTRATEGPMGIVLMDFVGARSTTYVGSTYNVYGDLLPQVIIDNNYKCYLQRKGE